MNIVHLTRISSNAKTGPIPVSTSHRTTCPDACPLKKNGCYADSGPLALHWNKIEQRGMAWKSFCLQVKALPKEQLWRHNQAGDLPGENEAIDSGMLADLVAANKGRNGFTYTHKPLTAENVDAIKAANDGGFTVNVSCNGPEHLDAVAALELGLPLVTICAEDTPRVFTTPGGVKCSVCPATYRDNVSCATCGLCQKQNRKTAVAFPVHGSGKKKAAAVVS